MSAFLARHWHRGFLLLAAAVIVGHYAPALTLAAFSADSISGIVFLRDVLDQPQLASSFQWSGHSDLFPDLLVLAGLYALLGDGLVVLQIATALLSAGFIVTVVWLYRRNGGQRTETFAAVVMLLYLGITTRTGTLRFESLFQATLHGGAALMALACLGWLQRLAGAERCDRAAWLLSAVCLLTTASNLLFAVLFTAPAVLALLAVRPRRWAILSLLILGSSLAGLLVGPHLFPAALLTAAPYVQLKLAGIGAGLGRVLEDCRPETGGYFVVLLALDVASVVAAIVLLPRRRHILLVFVGALVLCSWGALLATGNYYGLSSERHLALALLAPVVVLLAHVLDRIPWTPRAARLATATAALAAILIGLRGPEPNPAYRRVQALLPALREVMETEHVEAGLADYWLANPITFLSGDAVVMRSVSETGSIRHWFSNVDWYRRSSFRMILMHELDPERMRRRFGEPAKVVPMPVGELWLYSQDLPVSPDRFRAPAASLPSLTGQVENGSIVALAARDREDWLTYGPYLPVRPGRYRIEIAYEYREGPEPGRAAGYDALLLSSTGTLPLDRADLGVPGGTLVRELLIPQHGLLEARTYYRGSGSISIDSLGVSYLGP